MNTLLHPRTEGFIRDFELDHGVILLGHEETEIEYLEQPVSWNGHQVSVLTVPITTVRFLAEGFVWEHPEGAAIRGSFSKPILASEVTLDAAGDELELTHNPQPVRAAIRAKCGRVSGYGEALL